MLDDTPPPPLEAPPDYDDYPPTITPLRPRVNGNGSGHGRVPPHDWETEQALIGVCLIKGACIDQAVNTGIQPHDFHKPAHAELWRTILDLREANPDAVTPADPIRVHALINTTSIIELVEWSNHAVTANAARYAETIISHAQCRALIGVAVDISEAAYRGDPIIAEQVATRALENVARPANTETIFEDMQAVLEGNVDPVTPALAPRDDHATCLLYAPGITWLSGEPGKGKTLLAQWWTANELRRGQHVLYIDFEGTKEGTVARLASMGCDDLTRLSYVRRHGPWDLASLNELRATIKATPYTLCVIDAVAGAMEAEGLNNESNPDVEKWAALIPATCFAAGMGVVVIDHVVKNAESRGRWMIGAQRKMARADAAFMLDMHVEAGINRTGHGKLVVAKDRYGALAAYQQGKVIAHVAIASEEGDLRVSLTPPPEAGTNPDGTSKPWAPTRYMEEVSRILERAYEPLGIVELRNRIGKTKKWVDKAVDRLLDDGYIRAVPVKGRAKPFESVKPYREPYTEGEVVEAVGEVPPPPSDDDEPLF